MYAKFYVKDCLDHLCNEFCMDNHNLDFTLEQEVGLISTRNDLPLITTRYRTITWILHQILTYVQLRSNTNTQLSEQVSQWMIDGQKMSVQIRHQMFNCVYPSEAIGKLVNYF